LALKEHCFFLFEMFGKGTQTIAGQTGAFYRNPRKNDPAIAKQPIRGYVLIWREIALPKLQVLSPDKKSGDFYCFSTQESYHSQKCATTTGIEIGATWRVSHGPPHCISGTII
jgi:hypothetical protein